MKTIVYVDGLNLYYAALRGTPFKWLDPRLPDKIPGTRLTRPPEWSGEAVNLASIPEPLLLPHSAA